MCTVVAINIEKLVFYTVNSYLLIHRTGTRILFSFKKKKKKMTARRMREEKKNEKSKEKKKKKKKRI